jgi:hypothetical protein
VPQSQPLDKPVEFINGKVRTAVNKQIGWTLNRNCRPWQLPWLITLRPALEIFVGRGVI